MIKLLLKYNDTALSTEITIDDQALAKNANSQLQKFLTNHRLQDWIEQLPSILVKEYQDQEFAITFQGTSLDYQAVKRVFSAAIAAGQIKAQLSFKSEESISDKMVALNQFCNEVTGDNSPLANLLTPQQKSALASALSNEVEICVVATISAGKSTLINAMLGTKLMPSKQEACTAIITRLKHEDRTDFRAKVYGKDKQLLEEIEPLTYKHMQRLNDDERVSEIHVFGRIPFLATLTDTNATTNKPDATVAATAATAATTAATAGASTGANVAVADETAAKAAVSGATVATIATAPAQTPAAQAAQQLKLPQIPADSFVLIDTPGPNNSRNQSHRQIQNEFLACSSKELVLYVMTGEFGTKDEADLLEEIAKSMQSASNDKSALNRFIFLVNKVDERRKDDGDLGRSIALVHDYICQFGITDPKIYPISALAALNIRRFINGDPDQKLDENELDYTERQIKKFNRNNNMHLETWAALSSVPKRELNSQLVAIQRDWQGDDYTNPQEALFHTGVPYVEAAIRQYNQASKIQRVTEIFNQCIAGLNYDQALQQNATQQVQLSQQIAQTQKGIQALNKQLEQKQIEKDAIEQQLESTASNALQYGTQHLYNVLDAYFKQVEDALDCASVVNSDDYDDDDDFLNALCHADDDHRKDSASDLIKLIGNAKDTVKDLDESLLSVLCNTATADGKSNSNSSDNNDDEYDLDDCSPAELDDIFDKITSKVDRIFENDVSAAENKVNEAKAELLRLSSQLSEQLALLHSLSAQQNAILEQNLAIRAKQQWLKDMQERLNEITVQ